MKPSIPKGTRDFSSTEMARRNYIFDTIKKYFRLYGFEQIETPAMENLTTLTGKYGEEGDQLIYKILNSGDYLKELRINKDELDKIKEIITEKPNTHIAADGSLMIGVLDSKKHISQISERALRYDLTVPFARYVVMHQHEITFPFKRFQMQTVWRADKPQKGRYREFYQCDADIIGSNSMINEVELVNLMNDVYTELAVPVTIKINNRKILTGIAEVIGEPEKIIDFTIAIDKLDKIGTALVFKELEGKGFSAESISRVSKMFEDHKLQSSSNDNRLNQLKIFLADSEIGLKGIQEIESIINEPNRNWRNKVEFDFTLARGLNYYTGAIFEVKANAGTFTPSITGGGRYDDLTGIFGLANMSGVGISFGIDRIYDVMEELNLFPAEKLNTQHTQLLLMHMGEAEQMHGLQMLSALRSAGIRAELYPDVTKKMNKQFDYATKKDIPYLIVIGSNEMNNKQYTLKTKETKFENLTLDGIIAEINKSN